MNQDTTITTLKKLQKKIEDSNLPEEDLEKIIRFVEQVLSSKNSEKFAEPVPQICSDGNWKAWTDGACFGNPGPGGWAYVLKQGDNLIRDSGFSKNSTNNIMELTATIECLKNTQVNSLGVLYSDSRYVIQGITQWISGWKKRGWKKADGNPVLNAGLWKELEPLSSERNIRWEWLKGHAGNPENELCDLMAKQAIEQNT